MIIDTALGLDLSTLRSLYNPDEARINLAKRRQAALWAGSRPDAWPIIFSGELTEEQAELPEADLEQAFYSKELMLASQLRCACRRAGSNSDAVPSIRANLGTGVCLSVLGLKQLVFPDRMPWLQEHMSREQVAKLTPDDIKVQGDFERGLDMMRFFKEVFGDRLDVYCMDTQGPFDLAHLLLGDDIFYLPYDDSALMHHVMEICLEIGIRTHTWMKEVSGEPLTQHAHSCGLYAENMGIRICEDTTVLVGRATMDEYTIPYTRRLAEHFGGAWVHYCGRNDHLTAAVCELPEIRGVNFGIIPGRPHEHDFQQDMELIANSGKVYVGHWPPFDGESRRDWLRRIHSWSSRGALLEDGANCALEGEDAFPSVDSALEYWYSL